MRKIKGVGRWWQIERARRFGRRLRKISNAHTAGFFSADDTLGDTQHGEGRRESKKLDFAASNTDASTATVGDNIYPPAKVPEHDMLSTHMPPY